MAVVRAVPSSTPHLCRVVAALEDLPLGDRATVAELSRRARVPLETARSCLIKLKDSLLVDAREQKPTPEQRGRVARLWALTTSGRTHAPEIIARGPQSTRLGGGR